MLDRCLDLTAKLALCNRPIQPSSDLALAKQMNQHHHHHYHHSHHNRPTHNNPGANCPSQSPHTAHRTPRSADLISVAPSLIPYPQICTPAHHHYHLTHASLPTTHPPFTCMPPRRRQTGTIADLNANHPRPTFLHPAPTNERAWGSGSSGTGNEAAGSGCRCR